MDKGFTNILIILVTGLSLLLVGYYLGKQNSNTSLSKQEQASLATKESTSSSQKTAEQEVKPLITEVASPPTPIPIPSPTPIPYQLITGTQVSTYKNNAYGFSFNLPKSLFLYNAQTTASGASFLENDSGINGVRFGFEVVKTNAKLEDLAKQKGLDKRYDQGFNLEAGIINGHEALYISGQKSMRELCNFNSDEKRRIVLAALVKNKDYVLELTTNNTCYTFQTNWFDIITSSVNFN